MSDAEKLFGHESYALVGLSRISGAGRLFGSPLDQHYGTIRLRIRRARRTHSLSHDWYSGHGQPLIEIELSAAQFAEFLTTPGVGDGVPCTLRTLGSKTIEDPPTEHTTEAEEIRLGIKEQMAALGKKLGTFAAEVETALEAKTLTRESREKIRRSVWGFVQEMRSSMPFAIEQLQEAAEKTVSAAKAEVDAWLTRRVHHAGMKALGMPVPEDAPRELPAHDTTETEKA